MLRMRVLAGEIYTQKVYAEYIMRQMFPTTAEGGYLDEHAAQRGIIRKSGIKARGRVTFVAEAAEHDGIVIPAGTELCTLNDGLRFFTDSDVIMAANASTVTAYVTAAEVGKKYNVNANTVEIIVTPVLGIKLVNNTTRFTGGVDRESDELLRQRVIESYVNVSTGANAAYYRGIAMSVEGVYSASAVGLVRGAGTVNVYACGRGSLLSSSKLAQVQALLDEGRELNVDVRAVDPTPVNINLYIRLHVEPGYVFSQVADEVWTAVTDYIDGLGIGKDVLLCNIGEVIYHVKGVSDYRFLENYGSDEVISDSEFAVSSNILVRES